MDLTQRPGDEPLITNEGRCSNMIPVALVYTLVMMVRHPVLVWRSIRNH
jgi:hypothetical protein